MNDEGRSQLRRTPTPPPKSLQDDKSVLGRAFRILGVFNSDRTRLTLSEMSRHTGIAVATVHRLTGQLVDNGVLARTLDGTYELGPRLSELGALTPRSRELRHIALPHLQDLHDATGQCVHLVVRNGLDACYLERLSGPTSIPMLSRGGGRVPLHACSGGLVLLAYADPSLVPRILDRGLERLTPHTICTEEHLRTTLAIVRSAARAVCVEQMMLGALSIATPLFAATGEIVASVSLVAPTTSDVAVLTAALDVSTRAITRQLAARSAVHRTTQASPSFD